MAFLIILFIALPIAELYVIIKVGSMIGVPLTLAILLADALLGAMLLRHQGRSAWRRFNKALEERRFPGREVADGVAVTVGGTLLLTPGFITDVLGMILLIPPTRALVRRAAWWFIGWRYKVVGVTASAASAAGWGFGRMRGAGYSGPGSGPRYRSPGAGAGPSGPPPGYDVEGTAQEMPTDGAGGEDERRALPPR
ncbi:MAG: FxsA family protein [Solirubrobacterales bacterium]